MTENTSGHFFFLPNFYSTCRSGVFYGMRGENTWPLFPSPKSLRLRSSIQYKSCVSLKVVERDGIFTRTFHSRSILRSTILLGEKILRPLFFPHKFLRNIEICSVSCSKKAIITK